MTVAQAVRARRGDSHCGDDLGSWDNGTRVVLCVADGLGHGRSAEWAAQACLTYVGDHLDEPLPTLFSGCNTAIANTRGVAMGVARIDTARDTVEYCAVGNTRAMLVHGMHRRFLISAPGIVGGGYRRLQCETLPLSAGQRLFLYTDGLPRQLDPPGWQQRLAKDPLQPLADALLASLGSERDDNALLIYERL